MFAPVEVVDGAGGAVVVEIAGQVGDGCDADVNGDFSPSCTMGAQQLDDCIGI